MGLDDKIDNTKDKLIGSAKEKIGAATDNEDLQAEGVVQHAKGKLGDAGEKIKDIAKDALS